MKIKLIIILLFYSINANYLYGSNLGSRHSHKEKDYQHTWCKAHNGIEEFQNSDRTRVDCLTITHAVEFDFSYKWAESIGQALHYSYMTGKKAKVVLILKNPEKEMIYFKRVQNLSKIYNFDVEYIMSKSLTGKY